MKYNCYGKKHEQSQQMYLCSRLDGKAHNYLVFGIDHTAAEGKYKQEAPE